MKLTEKNRHKHSANQQQLSESSQIQLSDIFPKYFEWLLCCGKSKATAQAYFLEVKRCFDFLHTDLKEVLAVNQQLINNAAAKYLADSSVSFSTLNRRYQALLKFCDFMSIESTFVRPSSARHSISEPHCMVSSCEELKLKLSLPVRRHHLKRWQLTTLRNKSMAWLAVICGFKISDISLLLIDDVKINNKKASIFEVSLGEPIRKAVLNYLVIRSGQEFNTDGQTNFLFVNNQGQQLSVRTIQYGIKRYLLDCGTSKEIATVSKARAEFNRLVYGKVNLKHLTSE